MCSEAGVWSGPDEAAGDSSNVAGCAESVDTRPSCAHVVLTTRCGSSCQTMLLVHAGTTTKLSTPEEAAHACRRCASR